MNDTSNNYLEDGAEWGQVQDAIFPNGEDGKKANVMWANAISWSQIMPCPQVGGHVDES